MAIKFQRLLVFAQIPVNLAGVEIGVTQHFEIFAGFGDIDGFLVGGNRLVKVALVAVQLAQIDVDAAG